MAQLRDTIVSGNLRVTDTTLTDTLQVTIIKAPTSSGGTVYGPGTNGQILKSNGTTIYWAADSNTDTKVTSTLLAQSTAAATYLPTFVSEAGNSGVNIMNSFSFKHTVGTISAVGNSRIVLGNATASGTANNEEGRIVLYSSSTSYHTIKGNATASTVTHSLPTTGGTILNTGTTSFTKTLTSGTKIGSIEINGISQNIYAPTNINTTYTLTQNATDGHEIILTASSGTVQTITIPDDDTTYSAGSGLSLSGTTFNHSNSVTAEATFDKSRFKYDDQGHITSSSYYVHRAAGTGGVAGWVKIATMTHTNTYDNTPIMLTISQRGNLLTYRLHIQFSNTDSTDPALSKFMIASDEADAWVNTYPRAYMIRTAAGTWDLYINKKDSREAIVVTEFDVGAYFYDRMTWTWLDVQTDDSAITGGTEATRKVYSTTDENLRQSNTATSDYRPIVMGTTSTTDRSALNTTVTGQGYVSNLIFSKPNTGYIYSSAFSTSSYIDGTGAQLGNYGLRLRSYGEQNTGTKYSYSRYAIRTYPGKLGSDDGMLVEICSGGLTIVGSGDSASNLSNLIADDQTVENPARLNIGGTLNTAFQGHSEQLILSSDNNIYFVTNCDTIENRMPVVLTTNSAFYPGTTKTGSLGTSSYYWNTAYIASLRLSTTSELIKASGDTYYYAHRTDTDVKVGIGVGSDGVNHGVYSWKLGGWMIFGDATNVAVRATLYNPSTEASLYALPLFGGTPSTGAHALYNNNGFRYSTLEGTASAIGVARLVLGNNTESGNDGNKQGSVRLYSESSGYVDLLPASTSSGEIITIPATTATMAVNRKCLITDSSLDFESYAWHKFAEITITNVNYDYIATFLVSLGLDSTDVYVSKNIGVLTMHVRTSSTRVFRSGQFEWLVAGEQIDPNKFVMVYTDTADTSCKVELWYKQTVRYDSYTFTIIDEHTRTVKETYTMTLNDQSGPGSATYTTGTGTIVSKLTKLKNAPGIYAVKGTQTEDTAAWTGNIEVSDLYDGLTIAFYLPYASAANVTLELTLANGTSTGAISCYYNNGTRIGTHYGAGSTVILTYWSAATTGLSNNRWTRCDYTTTSANQTNTTNNGDYRVLFSTSTNDTTQSGLTRKNVNLKYNPSTANLQIGAYVAGSTTTKNGQLTFGNSTNSYNHTVTTNGSKMRNISLSLNDVEGIMGTDVLCYKAYEQATNNDTTLGAYATISTLSNTVTFDGYLARFSYFTLLICIGDNVANRYTIHLTSIDGYQSTQLIWGATPTQTGGSIYMTTALANITESNGNITIYIGKCSNYLDFTSITPTFGTTPDIHILKVYGHCIRSNGYH